MVSRIAIHSENLYHAFKWLFLNYFDFKKQLELQGYYSTKIYKIYLWKNNSKYFKAFDIKGRCYFIKVQPKDKVQYEKKVIQYIENYNVDRLDFYPTLISSCLDKFSYNIFEELDGRRIDKKAILNSDLIAQMLDVVIFFDKIKVVHCDIRPHNIIVVNQRIKIIDFEHCFVFGKKMINNYDGLNKNFSPNGKKWDDAYSFKKIIDYFIKKNSLINCKSEYEKLSNMINKNIYEYN